MLRAPRIPGPSSRVAVAPTLPDIAPRFTSLPARPFAVAVSPSGDHAFVSMPRPESHGLLALSAGAPWRLERTLWTGPSVIPRGIVGDRAGRYLLIANSSGGMLVADAARLLSGDPDPIAAIITAPATGSMQLALHPDERYAFVTDEDTATLSVFDFEGSLSSSAPVARLLGQVPLPLGPVGIACTPDGQHLFVTGQGRGKGARSGTLSMLRVAEVLDAPAHARVASVPAGDSPVRVVLSGELVWVTARGSNALLGFDAERLLSGRERALRAVVRVGGTPVGVTTVHAGSIIVVANSHRYGPAANEPQTLSVVDARAALAGKRALLGTVPTGAFPRELATLPDDRTVLVTNVFSQSLQAVRL